MAPSFGPSADLSPHAQRYRAQKGTTPLPQRFVFTEHAYPPALFATLSRSFGIRPNAAFTGDAIARIVVTGLLYFCQAHCGPQVRAWVMGELRTGGLYDGDLLDALVKAAQSGSVPVRGDMGSYMPPGMEGGSETEGEMMWSEGFYYTANRVERLPAVP